MPAFECLVPDSSAVSGGLEGAARLEEMHAGEGGAAWLEEVHAGEGAAWLHAGEGAAWLEEVHAGAGLRSLHLVPVVQDRNFQLLLLLPCVLSALDAPNPPAWSHMSCSLSNSYKTV